MSSATGPTKSCVECQRRKQKCNRQFPCNHCLRRGVAHLCRFNLRASSKDEAPTKAKHGNSKKRNIDSASDVDDIFEKGDGDGGDQDDVDVDGALNALGYMSHNYHLVLGTGNGPQETKDSLEDGEPEQSEELKAALICMPAKPYTDCLVDNWLNGANHHYYALFPPEFRTQYDGWWTTPHNKVTPELTSLILRVCACSLHFLMDNNVKTRLESELRADVSEFANRLHAAAERLAASIPPGKGGLIHVQQLFLTAFWFKAAEKWTEAWHAIGAAIRAANEIGLHQDSLSEGLSEFDREMRRRLWGILYMWDIALGTMLSRPRLVNHADCTFVMPTLALEVDPAQPDKPSPFRHMNLHCGLCLNMTTQPDVPDVGPVEMSNRLRNVVEDWFARLPAEYALRNPDTRWDSEYDWVVFQRRYLHLVGFMSLLAPLKPFITRDSSQPMSELEASLREAGVQAALDLMDVSWRFFENMASIGAKFHYAIFCIFDTATLLCSAFAHDKARNLPQRETVLEAIEKGLGMLKELYSASKTTAALYGILRRLLDKIPLSNTEKSFVRALKRPKIAGFVVDNTSLANPGGSQLARRILADSNGMPKDSSSGGSEGGATLVASSFGENAQQGSASSSSASSRSADVLGPPQVATDPAENMEFSNNFQPEGLTFLSNALVDEPHASSSTSVSRHHTAPITHSDEALDSNTYVPVDILGETSGFHSSAFSSVSAAVSVSASAAAFSQAEEPHPLWLQQPAENPTEGIEYHADTNPYLSEEAPSVLEYWDWQGLDLGNPGYWPGDPPV